MKWIAILLTCSLFACKPKEEKLPALPALNRSGNHAIVSCEGIFPRGNAGISVVDKKSGQTWEDVYFQANNRRLGDVLQSITFRNGKAYCVVNNSSKIEVVDLATWKSIRTVQNLCYPRYLHFTGNGQAWLTSIFSKQILILDENTLEVVKRIPFPHWTENMVQFGDTLYFNSPEAPYLYRASISKQQVEDSLLLPGASSALLKTGNTYWAAYEMKINGNLGFSQFYNGRPINSVTTENPPGLSTRLATNANSDTLYVLSRHLYRTKMERPASTTSVLKSGAGKNYYSFGIDPNTNHIWLGDAIDFQQRGQIEVLESKGFQPINTFKVGLIPGHIYFY